MADLLPAQIIRIKRDGGTVPPEVLKSFVMSYTRGDIPEYQMSAFLMAIFFRHLDQSELQSLTETIMASGKVLSWDGHTKFRVDKHSTGGVGDKTSLILGPLVAAAGLAVPMMSGRGLGHTGGTLDKLESIPGFRTQLSLREFDQFLRQHDLAFIGQTEEICPADRKLYALRDVTGTVENIGLVCASIMSKKIAEGIHGVVLDVKYGSGAFFKKIEDARRLAEALKALGERFGKKVVAVLSTMEQPLGRFAGNACEVQECIEIMEGKKYLNANGEDLYADTRELSLQLSAWMMLMSGRWKDLAAARTEAEKILSSGKALEKFYEICKIQGGDPSHLKRGSFSRAVLAERSGHLASFDVEALGYLNIQLGAGRSKVDDKIDPSAGLEFHVKVGSPVQKGQVLFTCFASQQEAADLAARQGLACIQINDKKTPPLQLIHSTIS